MSGVQLETFQVLFLLPLRNDHELLFRVFGVQVAVLGATHDLGYSLSVYVILPTDILRRLSTVKPIFDPLKRLETGGRQRWLWREYPYIVLQLLPVGPVFLLVLVVDVLIKVPWSIIVL